MKIDCLPTRSTRLYDPGPAPIVTTRWQDMSMDDKFFYYTIAINRTGNCWVFTIMFTNPTRRLLHRTSMMTKECIAQRMRGNLKGIPWVFALEFTRSKLLHFHGLLDSTGYEDEEIERKLGRVAGDYRKLTTTDEKRFFRNIAVVSVPTDWSQSFKDRIGPYGAARYATKEISRTMRNLRTSKSIISVSRNVLQVAKQMHREDVEASRPHSSC